jgi:hypothetical protein
MDIWVCYVILKVVFRGEHHIAYDLAVDWHFALNCFIDPYFSVVSISITPRVDKWDEKRQPALPTILHLKQETLTRLVLQMTSPMSMDVFGVC